MIRAVAIAALVLAAGAAAVQAGGPPRVVATDRDGRTVAELKGNAVNEQSVMAAMAHGHEEAGHG